MKSRLPALARKEMTQFLRDKLMLGLILFLYTAEVLMCVYSLSFDVRDLPTAFADLDRSPASRELIERFRGSGYFDLTHITARERELPALLERGEALAAVVIPSGFQAGLAAGTPPPLQVLLDGTNANTASVAHGYTQRIVQDYFLERSPGTLAVSVEHRPRIWYNAELAYAYFMTLSMIANAGILVGVVTAAASVVRERESGTIEQVLVTPIRPGELIGAKMLPTLVVGTLALLPALAIAAAVGVPMRGNLVWFFLGSGVFLLSAMAIGILVATFAETLQQALLMSFFFLFPVMFLSGTMVPVESMPVGMQYLAELSPLRHYMELLLGVFLKGVGLEVLWSRFAALAAIAAVLLGVSLMRFHRYIG
jgi:ABC-2 type transport system permease protein